MNIPVPPLLYPDSLTTVSRANNIVTGHLTVLTEKKFIDFSVNQAYVKTICGSYPMLQTRIFTNAIGGFNGSGTGNKSIMGIEMNDIKLSNFEYIKIIFQNLQGDVSQILGGNDSNQCPYINLQVDLHGDMSVILILVLINYANTPIPPLSGIYESLGSNFYSVSWTNDLAVNVVGVTNGTILGRLTPIYQPLPASWPSTYWSFKDIINANPNAKIVNVNTLDGGTPINTITTGLLIISGESNQQQFSSKLITYLQINNIIYIS